MRAFLPLTVGYSFDFTVTVNKSNFLCYKQLNRNRLLFVILLKQNNLGSSLLVPWYFAGGWVGAGAGSPPNTRENELIHYLLLNTMETAKRESANRESREEVSNDGLLLEHTVKAWK